MNPLMGWILIDRKGRPLTDFGLKGHHIVFSELEVAIQNLKDFPDIKADGWRKVKIMEAK